MQRNNGGPAFPMRFSNTGGAPVSMFGMTVNPGVMQVYGGMTLRDWFAGQALQRIIGGLDGWDWAECVRQAYVAADAMLAEREKE